MDAATAADHFLFFLNGYNPGTDALARLALEDVQKSGLSPKILEQAQVRVFSGNTDLLKERLGFATIDGNGILAMTRLVELPHFGPDGSIRSYSYKCLPAIEDRRYLHPKGKPARPYILPAVWAEKEKAHKPVWITEGSKKSLKLIQHGRLCISVAGVWNFKASKDSDHLDSTYLWADLEAFLWKGRTVLIAFDADLWTNPQVRFALYELAFKLTARGATVRFVVWKAPEGKGIDDYLTKQSDAEKALEILEEKALHLGKFILPEHRDEVLRALAMADEAMDTLTREAIVNAVAKRLGLRPKVVYADIKRRNTEEEAEDWTEHEKQRARALLNTPDLVDHFLEVCHTRYLGRDKTLVLIKLACVSRHFGRGLPMVLSGPSSVGKSELVNTVIETCDPKAVENFTRTSAQYLLYREADLDHRIVMFFELQGTSSTAEIIRSALSEGVLNLGTVLKDAAGTLGPKEIRKSTEGLVILSTHTATRLDYELSTRVLTQELTHDEAIARAVYRMKAGNGKASDDPFRIWKVADSLIEPAEVVVPYANQIADLFPTNQERFMRDFDKVLLLLKASALWHQFQRRRREDGAVIADERDYALVYGLADAFTESVLAVSEPVLKMLELCNTEGGVERKVLAEMLGVCERTLRRYVRHAEREGFAEVEGSRNSQNIKTLEIPKRESILPSPKNIEFDPDVRRSETLQTVDGPQPIEAVAICPPVTVCPDHHGDAAKRTEPGNGGCPLQTIDTLSETTKRTGRHGESVDSDSMSDEEFSQRGIEFYAGRGCTRAEAEEHTRRWQSERARNTIEDA